MTAVCEEIIHVLLVVVDTHVQRSVAVRILVCVHLQGQGQEQAWRAATVAASVPLEYDISNMPT